MEKNSETDKAINPISYYDFLPYELILEILSDCDSTTFVQLSCLTAKKFIKKNSEVISSLHDRIYQKPSFFWKALTEAGINKAIDLLQSNKHIIALLKSIDEWIRTAEKDSKLGDSKHPERGAKEFFDWIEIFGNAYIEAYQAVDRHFKTTEHDALYSLITRDLTNNLDNLSILLTNDYLASNYPSVKASLEKSYLTVLINLKDKVPISQVNEILGKLVSLNKDLETNPIFFFNLLGLSTIDFMPQITDYRDYRINFAGVYLPKMDLSKKTLHLTIINGANLSDANLSDTTLYNTRLPLANLKKVNLTRVRMDGARLARADLGKANLSEALLIDTSLDRANLCGAKLNKAKFVRGNLGYANLHKADLSNAILECTYLTYANLNEANLIETDLSSSYLNNATLINANLSRANLAYANLTGADLSGANLSNIKLNRAKLTRINLTKVDLGSADLSEAELIQVNLSKVNLRERNLRNTNLTKTDLSEANLSKAVLVKAILKKANLSKANLEGANLSDADLSKATLRNASLKNATLIKTNLSGANLKEANLTKAILNETDLSSANLQGANLSGLNLNRVNLKKANLSGANLTGVELDSIKGYEEIDFNGANLTNVVFSDEKLQSIKQANWLIIKDKIETAKVDELVKLYTDSICEGNLWDKHRNPKLNHFFDLVKNKVSNQKTQTTHRENLNREIIERATKLMETASGKQKNTLQELISRISDSKYLGNQVSGTVESTSSLRI